MTNQAYPSINDIAPSWADIQITFNVTGGDTLELGDIAGIKWSRKVEVGKQKGTSGGRTMARTAGEGDAEASMTLYRSGLIKLDRSLIKLAPSRGNQKVIGVVGFDVLVQHTPLGSTDIYTTKIKGCRYLADSDDMKEGNEADKIEITLNPIEIVRIVDGVEVVLI